jgi:hypothetical protein
MSLCKRVAVLERVHRIGITDVRAASDRELARFLSQLAPEELRSELADWPELDFLAVVGSIREHIPDYGARA